MTSPWHATLTGSAFGLVLTVLLGALATQCAPLKDDPPPLFVEASR